MLRRLLVPSLCCGLIRLDDPQAHHARDVLRLGVGDPVELFAPDGSVAFGVIESSDSREVWVRASAPVAATSTPLRLALGCAVPKGPRADWLVEKLGELGVDRFIPLLCDRSVVRAEGAARLERWRRISGEASRQSRRAGVMSVVAPVPLATVLAGWRHEHDAALWLDADARTPLADALPPAGSRLLALVGPEGGFSPAERDALAAAGLTAASLGATILRVETAAMACAAIVAGSSRKLAQVRP